MYAAPNIKRFVGAAYNDVDFFIHTWDINQYKRYGSPDRITPPAHRPDIPIVFPEATYLTVEDLESYRMLYNPVSMEVESYNAFEEVCMTPGRKRDPLDLSMFYSWRRSVLLCAEHSAKTGKVYDVVLKMRPDLIYASYRRLHAELSRYTRSSNLFYVDNYSDTAFEDVFWMSSFANMMLASEYGEITCNNVSGLRDHLIQTGIDATGMYQPGYAPFRPEAIGYNSLTQFKEIYECDTFWYSDDEMPPEWPASNPC
jgi:hypothetical protein